MLSRPFEMRVVLNQLMLRSLMQRLPLAASPVVIPANAGIQCIKAINLIERPLGPITYSILDHFARVSLLVHLHPIHINPSGDGLPLRVSTIPRQFVFTSRQRTRPYLTHRLPQDVVDGQVHIPRSGGHGQGNRRSGIERVGIIGP